MDHFQVVIVVLRDHVGRIPVVLVGKEKGVEVVLGAAVVTLHHCACLFELKTFQADNLQWKFPSSCKEI